ncbi:hypothetical protein ADUPG1_009331 [Aduncisulcus paluster]|uniref:Uncharacterized protein n=1 Tax=Aduncisulcus paluster TaxID=2918883 RepID=A0ABQ5KV65_9EUKA|nr:hypothetical protein ADUPG1_009331 [Aduncisulcus paluster]|eukprot:gnl/Carplike_NY0171/4569_a6210_295.p1 GENE.gnl/Carplike_NY0171/4569_a6210_295~~gnl/Carplike_NY0171/4569_a6210_295.p1  ORF type:complete len:351 (+),score=32.56 gnl/Carplike_NY0171/4569_a6210_295:66-1118(+)
MDIPKTIHKTQFISECIGRDPLAKLPYISPENSIELDMVHFEGDYFGRWTPGRLKKCILGKSRTCYRRIQLFLLSPRYLSGIFVCLWRDSPHNPKTMCIGCHSIAGKYFEKVFSVSPLSHDFEWQFFPIDIPDIVSCELIHHSSQGCTDMSLIRCVYFVSDIHQEQSIEQAILFEEAEHSTSLILSPEEIPVLSKFVQVGRSCSFYRPPLDLYDKRAAILDIPHSGGQFLGKWRNLFRLINFLLGRSRIVFQELHLKFLFSPNIHGIYVCLWRDSLDSAKKMRCIFHQQSGDMKTIVYTFPKLTHEFEWHWLLADVPNVIQCDIIHVDSIGSTDRSLLRSIRFLSQPFDE